MTLLEAVESFDVAIPATGPAGGTVALPGRLALPAPPTGLVLFAHGSGSSRLSPRNEFVASVLHESWIGTLLFDLLTAQEATDRVNVFDIGLLADRLLAAVRFVSGLEQTRHLPLGVFGASTGAAATASSASHAPAASQRIAPPGPSASRTASRRAMSSASAPAPTRTAAVRHPEAITISRARSAPTAGTVTATGTRPRTGSGQPTVPTSMAAVSQRAARRSSR